jgi:nucleotide-binding universal stress UspA family protein
MTATPAGSSSTYDVVLLVEQPLSAQDARQVRSLHEAVEDPVRYHVLLPIDDAAGRVESAMGVLGTGDAFIASPVVAAHDDIEEMQRELLAQSRADLEAAVAALREAGGDAVGETVVDEPVRALVAKVREVGGAEVIVLTRSHVVAEFLHVDWTSRARRKLGVPVLHLIETENFDEQAGGPEGISGF